MTLPFLSDNENREVVQRIVRDREPEEKRYRAKKSAIEADLRERGMLRGSLHVCALRDEEIHHLRQVTAIARDAIFEIIEGRDIKLSESDVAAITTLLQEGARSAAKHVQQELTDIERRFGLPPTVSQDQAVEMATEPAIQKETVAAVSIRAADLRRRQERESRAKRRDRIEKILLMVGSALVGVLGTLLAQWLVR